MSILSALHQQDGSIDELAKLPQAMIMQMAQRKEIGAEMVAPILARKAEMADAVARTKAMQNAGVPQPSIMEQLMQKTAEQQQPEPQAREMGIAQLPVKEDMYNEQRMAAGGIVAFANNPDQPVSEDMPREGETESDYMRRVRANEESIRSGLGEFFSAKNWDPVQASYRAVKQGIMDPWNRFINQSPESQAVDFRAAQEARTGQRPTFTNRPEDTARDVAARTEADKIVAEQKAAVEAAKQAKSTTTKQAETQDMEGSSAKAPTPKKVLVADKNSPTGMKAVDNTTGSPATVEPKQDSIDAMLAKYEKLISGSPEDAAKAKKEAMWNRLAEAGLNIMGGTSTNIAQNLALASPAIKGYGEDVKGLRAEEAAKLTQLAGLGLKGAALKQEAQKLGITAKHYDDWYKVQSQQNAIMGASRNDANLLRADTAEQNRILGYAKIIAAKDPTLDEGEVWRRATAAVTGKSGQNQFAGFSGKPLK